MTLRQSILLLIVAAAATVAEAQPFQPGSVYFGQNSYIEYRAGNLPLIITAPHGGTLMPSELTDRTCGTTVTDTRTQELIRELEYEIHRLTGRYPHIIICRISRRKIDVNRDVDDATCGNEAARPYWDEWHKYIDSAKAAVVKQWGKGLYLDIHGHGHAIQQLEWGYMLSGSQLALSDAMLNQSIYIDKSSIRTLAAAAVSASTHATLLRGPVSLGSLLASAGIPGVPSVQTPSPGLDPYFSGGYNTQRHGSLSGGTIDGVQLECHSGVRINHIFRLNFAAQLADGLLEFMKVHYFPLIAGYYSYDVFGSGIPLNAFDVPYSQNFDNTFAGDQTGYFSDNDAGFPGNYTLMTLGGTQPQEIRRYTVGATTSQDGYIYNTGNINSPADRALGLRYSSTTGPVAFGLRFVNNTGADIRSLTIQYTGEQWGVGGSDETPGIVVAGTLEFEYMLADRATNVRTGDYISVPALNFVSPNSDPAFMHSAVDGNAAANRRVITATVNVTIPHGGEIMLRWIDRIDDPGFDHLLAVDDVMVTPRSGETSVDSEGMSQGRLLIYPNPTSGSVTVEVPGSGEVDLQVRSITSKLALRRTIEAGRVVIDAGTLGRGIYLITVMRGSRQLGSGRLVLLHD